MALTDGGGRTWNRYDGGSSDGGTTESSSSSTGGGGGGGSSDPFSGGRTGSEVIGSGGDDTRARATGDSGGSGGDSTTTPGTGSGWESPDSGSDTPDSGTNYDTSDSDRYGSSSAIGSGVVDIGIDPDTGRAVVGIGGQGSGTATETPGEESSTPVFSVPTFGIGGEGSLLNRAEQAVEDATNGRAYGSPEVVEDIGSGAAVRTIPGVPENPEQWLSENTDTLRLASILLGILGTGLTVWSFWRD